MPTYEFRCPQGHDFEKFYRTIGGAEAQAACPECGLPAERVMSAAGFAFKGSGFYLTDYGKNAHREKGSEPRTGAPAAEGGNSDGGGEPARADSKGDAGSTPAAPAAGAPSGASPGTSSGTSSGASTSPGESRPAAEPKKREAKAAESKPAAPKKSASE
jgi:putative FmdB family regulatory protein